MHRTRCPGNVRTIKSLALSRLRFLGVDLDAGATPQAYKKAWLRGGGLARTQRAEPVLAGWRGRACWPEGQSEQGRPAGPAPVAT